MYLFFHYFFKLLFIFVTKLVFCTCLNVSISNHLMKDSCCLSKSIKLFASTSDVGCWNAFEFFFCYIKWNIIIIICYQVERKQCMLPFWKNGLENWMMMVFFCFKLFFWLIWLIEISIGVCVCAFSFFIYFFFLNFKHFSFFIFQIICSLLFCFQFLVYWKSKKKKNTHIEFCFIFFSFFCF